MEGPSTFKIVVTLIIVGMGFIGIILFLINVMTPLKDKNGIPFDFKFTEIKRGSCPHCNAALVGGPPKTGLTACLCSNEDCREAFIVDGQGNLVGEPGPCTEDEAKLFSYTLPWLDSIKPLKE